MQQNALIIGAMRKSLNFFQKQKGQHKATLFMVLCIAKVNNTTKTANYARFFIC
jgi:hypothetical protein